MALADIHIMPSITYGEVLEGFGIVFLEAAAAGIPSIAGNTGGQAEAVVDGRTGFVVDGTNVETIANAIRQLAENRQLRHEMGEYGRRWASAHEWQTLVDKTSQMIYGIC
jgi:phosphatidylinositol alpha-1,6-mannosyltransferase